jgi:lysophospholipase L1-like esterase
MRSRSTGRLRRIALGAACAAFTASCSSGAGIDDPAAASSAPAAVAPGDSDSGTYLALGESVPFGFRGGPPSGFSDADAFVGYPELVGEELGLEVVNASCPGETTASFLDPSAQSNGCENSLRTGFGYRTAYPLHVPYESADQSQLDLAVDTLAGTDDVELVTVQIGANDAFLCQQTTPSRCSEPTDLQALAQTVRTNLDTILSTLRGEAGFDGQVVVVTYYALDYSEALDYSDAFGAATQVLGGGLAEVAAANGADVADGYAAFRARATDFGGDSVAAGLVLPGDVHPTDEGQRLLADAVTAVVEE